MFVVSLSILHLFTRLRVSYLVVYVLLRRYFIACCWSLEIDRSQYFLLILSGLVHVFEISRIKIDRTWHYLAGQHCCWSTHFPTAARGELVIVSEFSVILSQIFREDLTLLNTLQMFRKVLPTAAYRRWWGWYRTDLLGRIVSAVCWLRNLECIETEGFIWGVFCRSWRLRKPRSGRGTKSVCCVI